MNRSGSTDVRAAMAGTPYDAAFYQHQQDGSLLSARGIVPDIMQLAAPASVVDVGCGVGAWLRVFQEHGVGTIAGVDGDWVDETMLADSAHRVPSRRSAAARFTSPVGSTSRFRWRSPSIFRRSRPPVSSHR